MCDNCMFVLNPVLIDKLSVPFALSKTNLITSGSGGVLSADHTSDQCFSPLVYVADDEVCLGQLQALRLGQE